MYLSGLFRHYDFPYSGFVQRKWMWDLDSKYIHLNIVSCILLYIHQIMQYLLPISDDHHVFGDTGDVSQYPVLHAHPCVPLPPDRFPRFPSNAKSSQIPGCFFLISATYSNPIPLSGKKLFFFRRPSRGLPPQASSRVVYFSMVIASM